MGQVTDNVTWPWKVKIMTTMHFRPNNLKTAGDELLITRQYAVMQYDRFS